MNHFPVLLLRNLHALCASQARACVLCAKLLQCCRPREHDLRTTPAQCNAKQALSSNFTLHSSHFTLALHLNSSHLGSSHLIPCLAQNTFQYYFVLQSLHKVFPSTTLYHKACTKHFPVLMPITKACRKLLPSTTLYYKACTKYFLPVLLCTTKLAHTRYTLDRRPWHEMGFSAKNSMFFDVPHFALFQTTAKQHFIAFFSSLFQKLFQLF